MKFDLNKYFLDENGSEISKDEAGNELKHLQMSNVLSRAFLLQVGQGQNCEKIWDWCTNLSKCGFLSLDESDRGLIQTLIKQMSSLNVIQQAQLIRAFNKENSIDEVV